MLENSKENCKEDINENEKLDGCLTIGIVGIFLVLIIYILIGMFKYPAVFGKTVLSFNNQEQFDVSYLELFINSMPILTWPFDDIDTADVKRNVEDVFSRASFIEKTLINDGLDTAGVYVLYLKKINDESKNRPLTFPIVSKILFKNTLNFSNDSLFLREIVNRCKDDAKVQFFCDNVIGSIQYLIVAYNSNEKDRKWYEEILDYFSNKYVDFLSSIFMDYTGHETERNDNDKTVVKSKKVDVKSMTIKDVVDDMIEVVDSVASLKNTATAIVENSIQVYQKVSSQIKENGEDKSDSSAFDSSSATREVFGSEKDNLSEIQDVRSLDLPKP